jgi:Ca2+-binding RTX toxin-like protein
VGGLSATDDTIVASLSSPLTTLNFAIVYGNDGNDSITGSTGNDYLFGGNNNDTIVASGGADIVDGGSGTDTFTMTAATFGGLNLNTATAQNMSNGSVVISSIENINAQAVSTGLALTGRSGSASVIQGGSGGDTITGGSGSDTITGGAGVDEMSGGSGVDTFVFGIGSSGLTHTTADIIWDFNINDDKIQTSFNSSHVIVADGSWYGTGASNDPDVDFAADAAAAFSVGKILVAYNANSSNHSWVAIDRNNNATFDVGDSFIVIIGINTFNIMTDVNIFNA